LPREGKAKQTAQFAKTTMTMILGSQKAEKSEAKKKNIYIHLYRKQKKQRQSSFCKACVGELGVCVCVSRCVCLGVGV